MRDCVFAYLSVSGKWLLVYKVDVIKHGTYKATSHE